MHKNPRVTLYMYVKKYIRMILILVIHLFYIEGFAMSQVEIQGQSIKMKHTQVDEYERKGITAESCSLILGGEKVKIPAGTLIEADGRGEIKYLTLPRDVDIKIGENMVPVAGKNTIHMNTQGGILMAVLARPVTLKVGRYRVPFAAKRFSSGFRAVRGEAYMHFHDNGVVHEGWLAEEGAELTVSKNRVKFAGDNIITFDSEGQLKHGIVARGYPLKIGRNTVSFHEYVAPGTGGVKFYHRGQVHSGCLFQDTILYVGNKPVLFKAAGDDPHDMSHQGDIEFHENGEVKWGQLKEDTPFFINGRKVILKADQEVELDKKGNLEIISGGHVITYYETEPPIMILPSKEEEFEPRPEPADCTGLYPEGLFKDEILVRDAELQVGENLIPFKAQETRLWSGESGCVWGGYLQGDAVLKVGANKILFTSIRSSSTHKGRMHFYENGMVQSGPVADDQDLLVGGRKVRFKTLMQISGISDLFYSNGAIIGGLLAEDTVFTLGMKKILFKALCKTMPRNKIDRADIAFYPDGSVQYGIIAKDLKVDIEKTDPAFFMYGKSVVLKSGQKIYFYPDGKVRLESGTSGNRIYLKDYKVRKK